MDPKNNYQGIWIDKHKAYIFSFKNEKADHKIIESGIETRIRIEGESKSNTRFGNQYLEPDTKNENRLKGQLEAFLKTIQKQMSSKDKIVLFGPADTKNILFRHANMSNIVGVETADSMTENQMEAWVRDYFNS